MSYESDLPGTPKTAVGSPKRQLNGLRGGPRGARLTGFKGDQDAQSVLSSRPATSLVATSLVPGLERVEESSALSLSGCLFASLYVNIRSQ